MLVCCVQVLCRLSSLECYDEESGRIDRSHSEHAIANEFGKSIKGRFSVICVENIKKLIIEGHYETFRVGSDEDIATTITSFTKLLNEIKNHAKNYDQNPTKVRPVRMDQIQTVKLWFVRVVRCRRKRNEFSVKRPARHRVIHGPSVN
ncbi:hypothetical protein Syun_026497 [Stephania yunnanensis]|uniref:Uncharacterized protein n=1 Tax=Stephania yunnanensis TaxID=152371 RepID=A0AAP0EZ11_9MAGN